MKLVLQPRVRGCWILGAACTLTLISSCIFMVEFIRYAARASHELDRQMYTADVIAHALLSYEVAHNGMIPSTLQALDIKGAEAADVGPVFAKDVSLFHMVPPGCRSGQRPVNVAVEAAEKNPIPPWASFLRRFPDSTVRIYQDGVIRSEFTVLKRHQTPEQ